MQEREHRCCKNRGEDTCVNIYRVVNKDTSGNLVYEDENRIIYNNIYNFRKDIQTNKKMVDLFEMRILCKEK